MEIGCILNPLVSLILSKIFQNNLSNNVNLIMIIIDRVNISEYIRNIFSKYYELNQKKYISIEGGSSEEK